MSTIILKVPQKKQKVKLIQSEKILNALILERQERYNKIFGFDEIKKQLEIEKEKLEIKQQQESDELEEFVATLEEEIDAYDFARTIENCEVSKDDLLSDAGLFENNISIDVLNKNFIAKDLENEPEIEIGLPEDRIVIPTQTIFTEIYSISNTTNTIETAELTPIIHSDTRSTIEVELAEKYIQNAYDSGYEDCREVANLNAQTKVNEAHKNVRRIDKLMLELRKHYANKLLKFNEVLIDLSCAIAEVIIENEVKKENNIVIKQIEKAINELNDDAVFSITVNPADAKILEDSKSALFSSKSFAATVITTDENIQKGGCILKTSAGNIDATINTQLKKIREEIITNSEDKHTNKLPFVNENIPEIEAVSEKFLQQIDKIDKMQIKENAVSVEEDDIAISDEGFVGKDEK